MHYWPTTFQKMWSWVSCLTSGRMRSFRLQSSRLVWTSYWGSALKLKTNKAMDSSLVESLPSLCKTLHSIFSMVEGTGLWNDVSTVPGEVTGIASTGSRQGAIFLTLKLICLLRTVTHSQSPFQQITAPDKGWGDGSGIKCWAGKCDYLGSIHSIHTRLWEWWCVHRSKPRLAKQIVRMILWAPGSVRDAGSKNKMVGDKERHWT